MTSETIERQLHEQRDFIAVFSTPEGKRVLAAILDKAGFTKEALVTDPVSAGMALGRRNLAAWILNTMNRDLSSMPEVRRNPPRR